MFSFNTWIFLLSTGIVERFFKRFFWVFSGGFHNLEKATHTFLSPLCIVLLLFKLRDKPCVNCDKLCQKEIIPSKARDFWLKTLKLALSLLFGS